MAWDEPIGPDELIRRAGAVAGVANSEAFRWLIEQAVESAHRDWEQSKTVELRERCFQRIEGIRALETEIQKIVDRGVAAAKTLRGREQPQSNNNP